MAPVASIIITTKDRAQLLTERSLPSALDQTFKNYEIMVIDDAGTDNTKEVMKQYPNVRYYRFSENKGLSAARNFGIQQARGNYVVCLDDDNVLMSEFLEKTIEAIKGEYSGSLPSAVGVGRIIKYNNFESYAFPPKSRFLAIDWGWLIKKEVFDHIRYDERLRANEDTDFGIRFWKKYNAAIIKQPLVIAFDTDDPKSSLSFPNERELRGIVCFLNKNLHEYKNYPDELRCLYRLAGRKFYRGGYKTKGLRYFWKSFLAKPGIKSGIHLFFILFGWHVYDLYMTLEERIISYV